MQTNIWIQILKKNLKSIIINQELPTDVPINITLLKKKKSKFTPSFDRYHRKHQKSTLP